MNRGAARDGRPPLASRMPCAGRWMPPKEDHPVLVDGKRLLLTGVLTPGSIAYAVAREALDNGAEAPAR